MDLLQGLNPQQLDAVKHGTGPALVLAGAGSGKTRVIAHRIAHLIQSGQARPENVLAVTFTNKAAQEMRDRVRQLVGADRSAEPLISTFHSLCVRILRREIQVLGYRRDFSIYDSDDQRRLMKQLLQERPEDLGLKPREVLSRVSLAKNHKVSSSAYAAAFPSPFAEDIADLYDAYNNRLKQSNALDFDDLLLKTVEILSSHTDRRDHYSSWFQYLLVDEYQDTNRPQYELLRLLTSKHSNVFVVGDEDQSIYRFRGADIGNILNFEKDFPQTQLIRLEQNYRSTQNILTLAGAVVKNNTERKGKTLWTRNQAGDVITCQRCGSAREEAQWVAARVREILGENPKCKIGVLYRTNFLSRNFEEVLLEEGIPYAVVGSVGFFNRSEVKDMLSYLRVLFNPEDDIALLRIINTPTRGIGAGTVERITQLALERQVPIMHVLRDCIDEPGIVGRSRAALARFHEMLDQWMQTRDSLSAEELIARIAGETRYREMLERRETAEEAQNRMMNIEELCRAASEAEERGQTMSEFLDQASLSSELDHVDPNARVVLMTLHSAKGLEFEAVFLAGLEEGLFPHAQSLESKEDLEEERRICYVGITRARRKLFLSWTPFRRTFGPDAGIRSQPSRFLGEMPSDIIEGVVEESPEYVYDQTEDSVFWDEDRYEQSSRSIEGFFGRSGGRQTQAARHFSASSNRSTEAKGSDLKSGMRVRHAQFGDGIIMKRDRYGADVKLTVIFSRVGKKTLIEKYAKLQAL